MRVPDNIWEDSYHYLFILLIGLAATAFYNISSGILRAMGRQPDAFTCHGDCLGHKHYTGSFVCHGLSLGCGRSGHCYGHSSGLFRCYLYSTAWKIWGMEDRKRRLALGLGASKKKLLALGLPVAFQNVIIGFGGIAIQYVINGLDSFMWQVSQLQTSCTDCLSWLQCPLAMPHLLLLDRI